MKRLLNLHRFLVLVVILFATIARADDLISKAAWRRPLGLALENPGTSRVHGDIDDGYWRASRRFRIWHFFAELSRRFCALAYEGWGTQV